MRTKSLILAAALGVAGAFSSSAQSTNVYSVNAVGYVNLTLKPGFQIIANPLNNPTNNQIASIIPVIPEGVAVYRWNGVTYDPNSFTFGVWDNPAQVLNPGDGAFFQNPYTTNIVVTFIGEVPQGNLTNSIPVGFSMKSSIVPQTGALGTLLNFNPPDGTVIYRFANPGGYVPSSFDFGGWDTPGGPTINVGEGFWVVAGAVSKWGRSFSANN